MNNRVSRILVVSLGLALFGGAAGFSVGFLVALAVLVSGPPGFDGYPTFAEVAAVGGGIGASVGTVLVPVIGGSLLRRVPIGQAVRQVSAWSLCAAVVGWVVRPPLAVPFAFVGLLWGSARLWRRFQGRDVAPRFSQPAV
jgi:hypothetical protein